MKANTGRSVHRIDLALPIVQTDSYEIFYTLPSSQQLRTLSRQKPLVDYNNNKKITNQTARIRSPARLKHLIGPIFVNLYVDMSAMTVEATSTLADTVSNPLVNSNGMSKVSSTMNKRNKPKNIKDDGDRSRSSSGDRLLYESLGSFEDQNINKAKNNNMWHNMHHPQLTSTKALHVRSPSKRSLGSNEIQLKASNTASLDNLSEQLTKNFFPAIQQIRHSRPSPELINNRMHLHREQKRYFMPILSRTRIVQ
jgi:hypothetical protein